MPQMRPTVPREEERVREVVDFATEGVKQEGVQRRRPLHRREFVELVGAPVRRKNLLDRPRVDEHVLLVGPALQHGLHDRQTRRQLDLVVHELPLDHHQIGGLEVDTHPLTEGGDCSVRVAGLDWVSTEDVRLVHVPHDVVLRQAPGEIAQARVDGKDDHFVVWGPQKTFFLSYCLEK